jgi:beta-lactamase class A
MKTIFIISLLLQSATTDIAQLASDVTSYLNEQEGIYAVWFQHLDDPDLHFSINPDTRFHAASTMKTPVMIELFRRVDAGDFDLSDSIIVENRFYSIVDGSEFQLDLNPGGNDPFERKTGEKATLYDLNHAMITYSSNISTNLIMQLVGGEETTRTMRNLGAGQIEVRRGLFDMKAFYAGFNNETTARDLGIIFEKIARGEAVNEKKDSLMVGILKEQLNRNVIPAGLPGEAVVGNKTGSITGMVHDSGIVWLPDGQSYVLIFLSKDLPENRIGTEAGVRVSSMIYEALTTEISE